MTTISQNLGSVNPDGGFAFTDFDKDIWEESKRLAKKIHYHLKNVKNYSVPNENWFSSLIFTFASVGYKSGKIYDKSNYLSFWKPEILKELPSLRIKDSLYDILNINPIDLGIRRIREMREENRSSVSDLIWNPRKVADNYEHKSWFRSLFKKNGLTIFQYALIGIGVYVGVPAVIRAIARRK